MSLPGYSRSGEPAVLYRAEVCEGLCGGGHLIEFRKREGQWICDNAVTVWIS